ncbi:iron complex transport system permease protein [Devosia crocina]|uniref:Iron complex transport system permease protein n=1 Tax=Devosia crocina TaxID=429728 RepID=A0A1I7NUN5_9HYPH|nr:iron ABC transporter permease [Devosia crocina]SFV38364.1 iron complex transport system permease protein [Devosia crocina]
MTSTMILHSIGVPARPEGDRSHLGRLAVFALALALVAAMALSVTTGASGASALNLIGAWLGFVPADDAALLRDSAVILNIRMPRMVLGVLIGSGLAVSGLLMQGLFRNPLADPGLVGVSSGSALGAIVIIVLGGTALAPFTSALGIWALPAAAFCGGLVITTILYRVATRGGQTAIATMLLAGIAIGALAGAFSGLLTYVASDNQLRDLTFWGMGSLAGANWIKVAAAGPIIICALAAAAFLARGLNAMTLGEATASHLGVPVQRFKRLTILSVAAATGASVAVSGGIGFVGIVVPHLLRLVIGPDHRYLLPASALLGATFLLLCDALSRTIVAPAELPIGIVTAAFGGPFFLWILLHRRSAFAW